jgi:outer membrane protein, heavy metal efflux system
LRLRHAALLVASALTGVCVPTRNTRAQEREAIVPVTMRQLLDSVAARHPLIEAARARVRAARGSRTTAGAFGNPMLMYQVENAPLPGREAPPMEREAMITGTFPLEPLYQRGSRVRRADAELRVAEAEAAVERQRVMRDAARTYYRTALAQIGLEVARDVAGWLDTVVTYNRARVKEGVAAEADLLRSELERDRAVAEATMQEADLARSRAALAAYLGEPIAPSGLIVAIDDAPFPLPDVSADPIVSAVATRPIASPDPSTTAAPPTVADRALAGRPEMRAARQRLAAAGAGVTSERTMLIRQVGATVGTKRSAGTTSLLAGVSLPFPLFDQNRGELARATAERDAAMFELAAQERAVRADVIAASEAAHLLTQRATALARGGSYLARADEGRRIALGAYREGAIPLIQVIDAARAWAEARLTFYQTLFAQHESVFDLLVAEGAELTTAIPVARDATRGANR